MTLEQAFKLRAEAKAIKDAGTRSVINNILRGEYDRCKEEAMTIALEDIAFINEQSGVTNEDNKT